MAKNALASPTGLLRVSWTFFRKHRALVAVLFWLLFLPELLRTLLSNPDAPNAVLLTAYREWQLPEFLGILASTLFSILIVWGEACVLLVGKRMIQSKAGRSRTSFRAVRHEAAPMIVPLILTSLLQLCFVFYRSLLFIIPVLILAFLNPQRAALRFVSLPALVHAYPWSPLLLLLLLPAVIYYLETFFFDVALVSEGVTYRAALQRSRELVSGKFVPVMGRLLALVCMTLVPAAIVGGLLDRAIAVSPTPLAIIILLLSTAVASFASSLFILTNVALYGSLRNLREVPRK